MGAKDWETLTPLLLILAVFCLAGLLRRANCRRRRNSSRLTSPDWERRRNAMRWDRQARSYPKRRWL